MGKFLFGVFVGFIGTAFLTAKVLRDDEVLFEAVVKAREKNKEA